MVNVRIMIYRIAALAVLFSFFAYDSPLYAQGRLPVAQRIERRNPEFEKLVFWSISVARENLKQSRSPEATEIKNVLQWTENAIKEGRFKILEVQSDMYLVGIRGVSDLLLDGHFGVRFLNNPVRHFSILLHEFQHAFDHAQPKRLTKFELESRGDKIETEYLILMQQEQKYEPSSQELVQIRALERGTHSAEWKEFLENEKAYDYDFLSGIQRYEFDVMPTVKLDQSDIPLRDNLVPAAVTALRAARNLQDAMKTELPKMSRETLVAARKDYRVYQSLTGYELFMKQHFGSRFRTHNTEAVKLARQFDAIVSEIKQIYRGIQANLKLVPNFSRWLNGPGSPTMDRELTDEGRKKLQEFEAWKHQ
jgi:hypothetical protein